MVSKATGKSASTAASGRPPSSGTQTWPVKRFTSGARGQLAEHQPRVFPDAAPSGGGGTAAPSASGVKWASSRGATVIASCGGVPLRRAKAQTCFARAPQASKGDVVAVAEQIGPPAAETQRQSR